MRWMHTGLVAGLILAAAPPAAAQGQQERPRQARQADRVRATAPTKADLAQLQPQDVLARLHRVNQLEIDSARLALRRGQSPQVKEMAQQLLRDHERLDEELRQVAAAEGIDLHLPFSLPDAAIEKAAREQLDDLDDLSGARFDAAWLASQPFLHQYAAALLDLGDDADFSSRRVNQLLERADDSIERHQEHAERLLLQNVRTARGGAGPSAG